MTNKASQTDLKKTTFTKEHMFYTYRCWCCQLWWWWRWWWWWRQSGQGYSK